MTDPSQTAFMGPLPSSNKPRHWLSVILLSVAFVLLVLGFLFYGLYQNRQAETTWNEVFEWAGCSATGTVELKESGTLEEAEILIIETLRKQLENRQHHLNLAMAQWRESQIKRNLFLTRIREIKSEIEQLEAKHPFGNCIQKCRS